MMRFGFYLLALSLFAASQSFAQDDDGVVNDAKDVVVDDVNIDDGTVQPEIEEGQIEFDKLPNDVRVFTPQQYYLDEDGDDWAPAIQRCFDAMAAEGAEARFDPKTTRPLICVFPRGIYKISKTVWLPAPWQQAGREEEFRVRGGGTKHDHVFKLHIIGAGAQIVATGYGYDLFRWDGGKGWNSNGYQWYLKGFIFRGLNNAERFGRGVRRPLETVATVSPNEAYHPIFPVTTQTGIRMNTIFFPGVIEDCTFIDLDAGIKMMGFCTEINRCLFTHCNVGIFTENKGYGFDTVCRIRSCRVHGNDEARGAIGYWLKGTDEVAIENCVVEQGRFKYGVVWANTGGASHVKTAFSVDGLWIEGEVDAAVWIKAGAAYGTQIRLERIRGGTIALSHHGSHWCNVTLEALDRPGLKGDEYYTDRETGERVLRTRFKTWDATVDYGETARIKHRMPWDGVDGHPAYMGYVAMFDPAVGQEPLPPWHMYASGFRTNATNPRWDDGRPGLGYRFYPEGTKVYYQGRAYEMRYVPEIMPTGSAGMPAFDKFDDEGNVIERGSVQVPGKSECWVDLGEWPWNPEGQPTVFHAVPDGLSHFTYADHLPFFVNRGATNCFGPWTFDLRGIAVCDPILPGQTWYFPSAATPKAYYARGNGKIAVDDKGEVQTWIAADGELVHPRPQVDPPQQMTDEELTAKVLSIVESMAQTADPEQVAP